jgi:hypothetical protein
MKCGYVTVTGDKATINGVAAYHAQPQTIPNANIGLKISRLDFMEKYGILIYYLPKG